jgi:hypothetical protein
MQGRNKKNKFGFAKKKPKHKMHAYEVCTACRLHAGGVGGSTRLPPWLNINAGFSSMQSPGTGTGTTRIDQV